jgi:hypothetical protein
MFLVVTEEKGTPKYLPVLRFLFIKFARNKYAEQSVIY